MESDDPITYEGVSYDDPPWRRNRRLEVALIVIGALILAGAVLWFARSPGPPTVPVGLQVVAETCEDPCDEIAPKVTVTWTPPEGGAGPTGYRLLRDGDPLDTELDGSELSFVDETVTIGEKYAYQVIAQSDEGDSAATEAVEARVPTPPADVAHLAGIYRVRLVVRSARSIGSAFGIENPLPGKRSTDRWSFESTCGDDEGSCPSIWSGLEGSIVPRGSSWTGTVEGLPARCGREGRAPAPIEVDLETVDVGVVDTAWVVSTFRGSATVSFQCPGFPPASATVQVTGRL